MLFDCVQSFISQVDLVVIMDNRSVPYISDHTWGLLDWWESGKVKCLAVPDDPPNISYLWNRGLDLVESFASAQGHEEWDVAVLNSDVVIRHHDWFARMAEAMRQTDAVLAYPDQFGGTQTVLHKVAEPVPLNQRITGYAHMMRGESHLRYDETMAWWYSDDDLDWTARERGGALLVPGLGVEHREPNGSTNARPELQIQAGKDRETFRQKWGRTPH